MKPFCLTIAGADPSSGAGIQADIRTFDRLGVHPFSVITALTYQTIKNYMGYRSLSKHLDRQLKVLFDAYPINVVKIGMIPDVQSLQIIRSYIIEYHLVAVLDPVLSASAGGRLSTEGLELEIERDLFPVVSILTPNFSEALYYGNMGKATINSIEDAKKLGSNLLGKLLVSEKESEKAVVIKSISLSDNNGIFDLATIQKGSKKQYLIFKKKKKQILSNVHGTGCIFSSAIAAYLAKKFDIETAIKNAEVFFDEKFQKLLEFPAEGLSVDLGYSEDQVEVINQIKEIYNFISNEKNFSKLIPEVRMNISGALPYAKTKDDVAGIEGRISIVEGFPQAVGAIKFGVTDHTARLVLTAKEFDNDINFAMNLKFNEKWVQMLSEGGSLELQEIKREKQPKSVRDREYSTMQWVIRESVEKIGKIPDLIWDRGAMGKEPMIRLFSRNSKHMIQMLTIIKGILFKS